MKHLFRATFICLLFATHLPTSLDGQYLVSSESLGVRTIAQLEAQLGHTVRTGVSLYKLHYMTTDVHGMPDTASGLLVYPEMSINDAKPMVIYQHGTTDGPAGCPFTTGLREH